LSILQVRLKLLVAKSKRVELLVHSFLASARLNVRLRIIVTQCLQGDLIWRVTLSCGDRERLFRPWAVPGENLLNLRYKLIDLSEVVVALRLS